MAICYVCQQPLGHDVVQVSKDLTRHHKCRAGSRRWMASPLKDKSQFKTTFEAIQERNSAMTKNIIEMSTKEMVEEYNTLTSKSIQKFSSRKAGEKQLAKAREEFAVTKKVEKVAQLKSAVQVAGVIYKSVRVAFRALDLPDSKHQKFRKALKLSGKETFRHEGTDYEFAVVNP